MTGEHRQTVIPGLVPIGANLSMEVAGTSSFVIAGLVPAIHRVTDPTHEFAAPWIAGTSPAMTT
jgi:hypothetical protein